MLTLLLLAHALAADAPEDAVIVQERALDAGIVGLAKGGLVTEVVQDAAAWKAGIRPGTRLARVAGARTRDMSLDELRGRLTAAEGTVLQVMVEADGQKQDLDLTILPYDPANAVIVTKDGTAESSLWCEAGDCENGSGKATNAVGDVLAGPFEEGLLTGFGLFRGKDGSRYDGGYDGGLRSGPGAYVDVAKNRFAGEWALGVADGPFTVRYADRGTYEGHVRALLPHGFGTRKWPDGRVYVGEFDYGLFHGQGDLTIPGGEHYVGAFQNGVAHGNGVLDLPRGDHLEGSFYKGRLQGQGMRRWADNGRIYVGAFDDNEAHGEGTLFWADDVVHHGQFAEGDIQGPGVRFIGPTRRLVGRWYDERRVLGVMLDDKGEVVHQGFFVAGRAEGWGRTFKNGEPKPLRMYFNDRVRGEHPRSVDLGREEKDQYEAMDWDALEPLKQLARPMIPEQAQQFAKGGE